VTVPRWRAAAVWVVIAVLMVAHGTARERWLTPRLGELRAHQVGCLTGSALVVAVTWLAFPWLAAETLGAQLRVGAFWLALTVAFEGVFGRAVAGHSWRRLLHDYDLRRGRLWTGVLAVTFLAPWIAARLHA